MNDNDYNRVMFIRLNARITRAQIKMAAMVAENMQRQRVGESMTYKYDDFLNIINEECIDDSSIILDARELY